MMIEIINVKYIINYSPNIIKNANKIYAYIVKEIIKGILLKVLVH